MPYEELPPFINGTFREKQWGPFSTLTLTAAAGGLILSMLIGQALAMSAGAEFLLALGLIGSATVLSWELRGILIAQRLWLLLGFWRRRLTGRTAVDFRAMYAVDETATDLADEATVLFDTADELLLIPADADPV